MKVRDLLKILVEDGWTVKNPSIDVPAGTLSSILKQAGLKK
jgi:predicted RNA binding protein YcfA (HicA-like mRNA interferase family)